jgi:hypothetical protein
MRRLVEAPEVCGVRASSSRSGTVGRILSSCSEHLTLGGSAADERYEELLEDGSSDGSSRATSFADGISLENVKTRFGSDHVVPLDLLPGGSQLLRAPTSARLRDTNISDRTGGAEIEMRSMVVAVPPPGSSPEPQHHAGTSAAHSVGQIPGGAMPGAAVDPAMEAEGEAFDDQALDKQDEVPEPTEAEVEHALAKLGSSGRATLKLRGDDSGADEGRPPLTVLRASVKGLSDLDCVAICSLLLANGRLSTLTSLQLSNNSIGDGGARAIGSALIAGAPSLRLLALHENHIGCAGFRALCAAFTPGGADSIAELRISFNRVADDGVCALASAWDRGGCTQLRGLHASANKISDAGCAALSRSLHAAPLLLVLAFGSAVGGNQIGDEGARELIKALRSNAGRPFDINLKANLVSTEVAGELKAAAEDCSMGHLGFQPHLDVPAVAGAARVRVVL